MQKPPDLVISTAASYALNSPCAKSKRGVVIFGEETAVIYGVGWNGPPLLEQMPLVGEPHGPFTCDGQRCRSYCRDVAVHAEERAVRSLGYKAPGETHLVHVKVDPARPGSPFEKVVAGGGPSCVTCSRTIVDSRWVTYVWLLEAQEWRTEIPCERCRRITVVAKDSGTDGVCHHEGCRLGILEMRRAKTIYEPESGVWKRYTAEEFHRTTLYNLGLYGGTPS